MAATEFTIDQLLEKEAAAGEELDKARVACRATIQKAKDKLAQFQSLFEDASRERCWLTDQNDRLDALTQSTGEDIRRTVESAQARHAKRQRDAHRTRRPAASKIEVNSVSASDSETAKPKLPVNSEKARPRIEVRRPPAAATTATATDKDNS